MQARSDTANKPSVQLGTGDGPIPVVFVLIETGVLLALDEARSAARRVLLQAIASLVSLFVDLMEYFQNFLSKKAERLNYHESSQTGKTGCVTIPKDKQNIIGISIGGGAPTCPTLYIVQVFDNTPAATDGTLQAGDEIIGVNGKSVRGRNKMDVARAIQAAQEQVSIQYIKLNEDSKEGISLDIGLKKMKHRIVEKMSASTADALGLSRAILCNDHLVKKLEDLEQTAAVYKGMMDHMKNLLQSFYAVGQTHKDLAEIFASIGVREIHPNAYDAFNRFAECHRNFNRVSVEFLRKTKPIVTDLNTYLNKAIPDTKMTLRKYLDAKFEYLSYCLKVKEMDDEEQAYQMLGEVLFRVETGNYDYRLVLRCRQLARERFGQLRQDVLVKLELLDQKHVQDIVNQLQKFLQAITKFYSECEAQLKGVTIFPIELDIQSPKAAVAY